MSSSLALEERVGTLESVLGQYIVHTDTIMTRLERSVSSLQTEMKDFKDEMKDFKDEMKDFKDEMKDFKDEMKDFKDEMKDFKDEMKDFKAEMLDFKDEMKDFKDEMKDFKDEMKDFKDEMKDFKDEMKDFKDEMKDFKDEMLDFKDEMKDFKDEMKDFKTESNKKWGELANKMGTLVEDLVGPAFIPMAERCFGEEIVDKAIYLRRRRGGVEGEFDIVAASERRVYLVEVKSTVREAHIEGIITRTIPLFKELCPEYAGKPVVPILASLQIDESLVNRCTKSGVYAMAFREWDYMDILNLKELEGQAV